MDEHVVEPIGKIVFSSILAMSKVDGKAARDGRHAQPLHGVFVVRDEQDEPTVRAGPSECSDRAYGSCGLAPRDEDFDSKE